MPEDSQLEPLNSQATRYCNRLQLLANTEFSGLKAFL